MKFKMKALVAAVALTVAGAANADIATFSSGDGELFLSVRNNTTAQSIVFDTNIALSAFNGGANLDFADTGVQSFVSSAVAAGQSLTWAVMAGDSTGNTVAGGINYLTTTKDASISGIANNVLVQFTGMDSYIINNNSLLGTSGTSAVSASGTGSYFDPTMDNWQGNANFYATAGVGETMNFFMLTNTANTGSTRGTPNANSPIAVSQFGTWTLGTDGGLHYAATTLATPVPPALWLLGSALLGLVGVARRKNTTV